MKCTYLTTVMAGLILFAATASAMSPIGLEQPIEKQELIIDNSTYINANSILMFVTNHGNFGRDLSGVFGYDAGTFYPYVDNNSIMDGSLNDWVLYAAGLWVGGRVNGEIRMAISEYSDEYVPGPMANGTYQPDNPSFKVYKLYKDSLANNPNSDYLNWPVDQGAPVDEFGNPAMLGDQMLWTVFNDADPFQHTNNAGETDPLCIEIQKTVWATRGSIEDTVVVADEIEVTQTGSVEVEVKAFVTDQTQLTQDSYAVDILVDPVDGPMWQLRNVTTGTVMIAEHVDFYGHTVYTDEGFAIQVTVPNRGFVSFQVVANGAGPLDPPESGAFPWAGFPVPTDVDPDGYPTDGQQVGNGIWGFHTADNGGTSGGGDRGSYDAFISRVTRDGGNFPVIGAYDYEMRFTGDNSNPGVGGSYAIETFNDENVFWVPFELWNIGIGTPNDPNDDVRLFPLIIDEANPDWSGDNIYALESWGSVADGTCSGDCEHSVSGGDNDPFTDWVYWYTPTDMSPGEAGYLANEADFLGAQTYEFLADEVFARTVLVNWNGGDAPPFNQDCPELGTVFRIITSKTEIEPDIYTFTPSTAISTVVISHNSVIYTKYKLYNKGGNTIEDAYISLWTDPDLGDHTDDLVGCDTLNDIFFCYNADNDDAGHYGSTPPALGFKILTGPLVPSSGDTANFDGTPMPGYKNLPMTSFQKYINGTDPNDFVESYNYMQGLNANGSPLSNGTHYAVPGDPVTGTGDLDFDPSDRRGMGTCGPINMMPGDSQYVLIKMAVGQGDNRLESITAMKEILNATETCCHLRGDINHQDSPPIDISDLVYLINYMFLGGPAPVCLEEGNVNADEGGSIDISDLVYLIDYSFLGGPAPPPCQ